MIRLVVLVAAACCACGCSEAASDTGLDGGVDGPAQCVPRVVDVLVVKGVTTDDADTKQDVGAALGRSLQRSAELRDLTALDIRLGIISSNLGSFGSSLWDCQGQAGDSQVGDGAVLLTVNPTGACSDCDANRILGTAEWPTVLSLSEISARGADAVTEAVTCAFMCSGSPTYCNVPQHLEALARAPGANSGFVRDGSVLAILLTAAIDDASTADPSLWDDQHLAEAHCYRGYRSEEYLFPVSGYGDSLTRLHDTGPIVLAALAAPGDFVEGPPTLGCPDGSVARVCRSPAATSLYPTPRVRQLVAGGKPGACPDVKGVALDFCAADMAGQFDVFVDALASAAGIPQ